MLKSFPAYLFGPLLICLSALFGCNFVNSDLAFFDSSESVVISDFTTGQYIADNTNLISDITFELAPDQKHYIVSGESRDGYKFVYEMWLIPTDIKDEYIAQVLIGKTIMQGATINQQKWAYMLVRVAEEEFKALTLSFGAVFLGQFDFMGKCPSDFVLWNSDYCFNSQANSQNVRAFYKAARNESPIADPKRQERHYEKDRSFATPLKYNYNLYASFLEKSYPKAQALIEALKEPTSQEDPEDLLEKIVYFLVLIKSFSDQYFEKYIADSADTEQSRQQYSKVTEIQGLAEEAREAFEQQDGDVAYDKVLDCLQAVVVANVSMSLAK